MQLSESEVRRPLDRALRYASGSHTAEDMDAAVARGELQRWDGECSTIITEIKQTPGFRYLLIFLAEGNLRELAAMLPPILEWAETLECTRAIFHGRPGWSRTFLAAQGWRPTSVTMELNLGADRARSGTGSGTLCAISGGTPGADAACPESLLCSPPNGANRPLKSLRDGTSRGAHRVYAHVARQKP